MHVYFTHFLPELFMVHCLSRYKTDFFKHGCTHLFHTFHTKDDIHGNSSANLILKMEINLFKEFTCFVHVHD